MMTTQTLYTGPTADDLATIPAELKALRQWMLFQLLEVPKASGELKYQKVPVNPSSLAYGSSTAPATWDTYALCVGALPQALATWGHTPPTTYKGAPATYQGAGIGVVFTADDPYMLVDLDKSLDPETGSIADWAHTIIDTLQSYTQRSVSGHGLHALVKAKIPPGGQQHGNLQMWDSERFCAMTGWHLPETPTTIEARQSQLTMVHSAYILKPKAEADAAKARATRTRASTASGPPRLSDQEIMSLASRAKNGGKFTALWAGDIAGYTSQSEADEALLSLLTFYTRDEEQLDSLFRQSGLMDEKWEKRPRYRERTIAKALDTVTEHYDPVAYKAAQEALKGRNGQPQASTQDPPPQEPAPPTRNIRGPEAPLPYSDYTNALAFVRDHGQNLRYCYPWKSWLVWTGTHWQRDTSGAIMRYAKQTIKRLARHAEDLDDEKAKALMAHVKASLSTAKLKAMVESAQSEEGIPVQPEAFDSDRWLLNCANGTLDLRTGTLRPHAREDLQTLCLAVAYEMHAGCPTWDAFLERIMAGNEHLISFLQHAIGYALTGVIREHVLLILWGTGRNGKSTFLNALRTLLGPYGMKAPSELLMVSNNDRHPTERADLLGKRFVAAIETEQGRQLAEVFVKEATGGDPIRARRMREDFWEFEPTHKVFLATNHRPVITGTDNAIWERIRLVPFTVTIPAEERDTSLLDKLLNELPGILAWAVEGCLAWQQQGLGQPEEVEQATAGYRAEMDTLGQFIKDCCLTGNNYRIKAADLYEAYKRWGGDQTENQRTWGMALTERGFERKRGTAGSHWWLRIALAPVAPQGDKDQKDPVTQVTDSDPKNGINTSINSHVGGMGKHGSLGSLGSLPRCPKGGYHNWVKRSDGTRLCAQCNAEE